MAVPSRNALAATQDSVPYGFVLVEDFGGTWCNNCPALTDSLVAIAKQIENMAIVGYHIGETRPEVAFLYNYDAYGRSGYYDTVQSLPSAFVNGKKVEKTNKIRQSIEEAASRKTPYELKLEVAHFPDRMHSRDSFSINVHIQRVAPDIDRRIRLYLAFTQDHLVYKWYNQSEVNHALTFMYPNQEGTMVELDDKGNADLSFRFGADYAKSRFPVKNGNLVVFIQDETVRGYDTLYNGKIRPRKDNTVLQTARIYLGEGDYTHIEDGNVSDADFHNRNAEIADRQSARYYDNTFGTVDSYHWVFEGGEPAVSDLASPTVFYNTPGNFATTLTVTRNGKTSTIRKENVISVLNVYPKFSITPSVAKPNRNIKIRLLSEADTCTWSLFGSNLFTAEGKEISVSYPFEGKYNVQAKIIYTSPVSGRTYTYDTTAKNAIEIDQNAPVANNPANFAENIRVNRLQDGSQRFGISGVEGMLEYADVFSMSGQCVLRARTEILDLAAYPAGIYVVCVKTKGNQPVSFKISK
ncbi:MAG: hypothetical protein K2I87_00050 [Bacteroidales bacterium]|nr:hypothetical protein [Bacteroidales bacterium]